MASLVIALIPTFSTYIAKGKYFFFFFVVGSLCRMSLPTYESLIVIYALEVTFLLRSTHGTIVLK